MTTVEALQGLYVAMGGSAEDVANVSTIPDMIQSITTQYESTKSVAQTSSTTSKKSTTKATVTE